MKSQTKEEPLTISCSAAAKLLGISRRTLQRWCAVGAVPHLRIGKKLLFSPRTLRNWVDSAGGNKELDSVCRTAYPERDGYREDVD